MDCAWKPNWEETKKHFLDWWNRKGPVIGGWGAPWSDEVHEDVPDPGPAASLEASYTDVDWRIRHNHYVMAHSSFPGDVLPRPNCDIGPGTLALLLGCPPKFTPETVWYYPMMEEDRDPEKRPPLKFDPENRFWKIHEATLKRQAELGKGKYAVGYPDLIENTDILASLRGVETTLADMIERPEWVSRMMSEINQVWFEVCRRMYDIIKLEDGSSIFHAFGVWSPGRVSKLQCDNCAMFSPAMFRKFVQPALAEQCVWLDRSIYHLDGSDCLPHLDALLEIEDLDAIEWTPDVKVPSGGNPHWYPLYKRILAGGKCVQAIGVQPAEVIPLLDACGGKGMYIMTDLGDPKKTEELLKQVDQYR